MIINVASSRGLGDAAYGSPDYGAAKAGLIRLTTCLAELPTTHAVRAAYIVFDWIGLDRAHGSWRHDRGRADPRRPPLGQLRRALRGSAEVTSR